MRGISGLILGLFCSFLQAQDVSNNSFETWSGNTPSSWITNESLYGISDTIWTSRDTILHNNDSSSVILMSDTFLATSNESAVIPASLIYGTFHHTTGNANATVSPIAYNHKPDTLYFDYKYAPTNNDSASFQFVFYNGDSALLNVSGILSAQSTWKTDTIILTSLFSSSNLIPDSLFIQFRSSANSSTAQLGSKLWLDNIHLRIDSANLPSTITTISENELSVYPNPVSDILFVDLDENCGNSTIEMLDLQGRLLLTQKAKTGKNALKAGNFENGFYMLLVRFSDSASRASASACKRILITH